MMNEKILSNMNWLGDPGVTLVSDDGYQYICHSLVLGIHYENIRQILAHERMKEYVLIFQQTNHLELKELINTAYASFEKIIEGKNDINSYGKIIDPHIEQKESFLSYDQNKETDIQSRKSKDFSVKVADISSSQVNGAKIATSKVSCGTFAVNNGQSNKSEEIKVVDKEGDEAKISHWRNADASPVFQSEINLKSEEEVSKTIDYLFKNQNLPQNLVCEVCSKSYKTRKIFNQHLRRLHPEKLGDKKCQKCHFCNFNSSNIQVMKNHVLWNHKEMC